MANNEQERTSEERRCKTCNLVLTLIKNTADLKVMRCQGCQCETHTAKEVQHEFVLSPLREVRNKDKRTRDDRVLQRKEQDPKSLRHVDREECPEGMLRILPKLPCSWLYCGGSTMKGANIAGKLPCHKCTRMCSVLFPIRETLRIPEASSYNCQVSIVCDTLICRECRDKTKTTTDSNTSPT